MDPPRFWSQTEADKKTVNFTTFAIASDPIRLVFKIKPQLVLSGLFWYSFNQIHDLYTNPPVIVTWIFLLFFFIGIWKIWQMGWKVNLLVMWWFPPHIRNEPNRELLIPYFLHTIYNSMDYLPMAAVPMHVYKSNIPQGFKGGCIHSCKNMSCLHLEEE